VQDTQNIFGILYYVGHTSKTALTHCNQECPHAPNVNLKRELKHGLYFSSWKRAFFRWILVHL